MTAQPGLDFLIPDKLGVLVSAPAKGHDKCPSLAQPVGIRIDHLSSIAKVDLCLLARPGLDTYGHLWRERFHAAYKAVDRCVTTDVATFLDPFVNGRDLDTVSAKLFDQIAVRFDR